MIVALEPLEALQSVTCRILVARAFAEKVDVDALEDVWCELLEQAADRHEGAGFWDVVDRCLDFLA